VLLLQVAGVVTVEILLQGNVDGGFQLQSCCRKVTKEPRGVAWSLQPLPSTSHYEHTKVPRGILQCNLSILCSAFYSYFICALPGI